MRDVCGPDGPFCSSNTFIVLSSKLFAPHDVLFFDHRTGFRICNTNVSFLADISMLYITNKIAD